MSYDPRCDTRYAGTVLRYHAWTTLKQQSVGEHSWQVLRIFDEIFKGFINTNVDLLLVYRYILWHDAPELRTGDVPYHVKKASPAIKAAMDEAETKAWADLGVSEPKLEEQLRLLVKFADVMEMFEFGVCELRLGNTLATQIVHDTAIDLRERMDKFPSDAHRVAVQKYRHQHGLPTFEEGRRM